MSDIVLAEIPSTEDERPAWPPPIAIKHGAGKILCSAGRSSHACCGSLAEL